MKIVNRYIGVRDGYLGDFTYGTHAEFYPEYCGLDIDPATYPGTTRERFIEILGNQSPRDQAKILRGVIDRFDHDADNKTRLELRPELESWIARLESAPAVELGRPEHTRDVVIRALADADELIRTNGATSAVDRSTPRCTAMFYHRARRRASRPTTRRPRTVHSSCCGQNHPGLAADGPRGDITRILGRWPPSSTPSTRSGTTPASPTRTRNYR